MSSSTEDFKGLVQSYIQLHDELSQTQKIVTALKKTKSETMQKIVNYMTAQNIDAFDVGDGENSDIMLAVFVEYICNRVLCVFCRLFAQVYL